MRAVVDVSGRPYLSYAIDIPKWQMLGDYDVFLTPEFFRALVLNAGLTVHMDLIRGDNPHHIVEAAFKAFARALDGATQPRPARGRRALDQGRAVIVVVDYGVNNLKSVVRALAAGGHAATLTTDPDEVRRADHVVMPGVGHFGQASRNLATTGLGAAVREAAAARPGGHGDLPRACSSSSPRAPRRRRRAGSGSCPGEVRPVRHHAARAARRLGAGGARPRPGGRHPVRRPRCSTARPSSSTTCTATTRPALPDDDVLATGTYERGVPHDRGPRQRARRAVPSGEVAAGGHRAARRLRPVAAVTSVRVSLVDLYVLRGAGQRARVPGAAARRRRPVSRARGRRCTATSSRARRRPTRRGASSTEETGLAPERLYNLSRVETFYQHRIDEVALVPVFAAFVAGRRAPCGPAPEHDRFEWLPAGRGARPVRLAARGRGRSTTWWPCSAPGGAGAVEDVLRVC